MVPHSDLQNMIGADADLHLHLSDAVGVRMDDDIGHRFTDRCFDILQLVERGIHLRCKAGYR